jgi:lysophospholipase L1-like esterase
MIVACLGSSTTAGKGQAYDWIGALARDMADKHIQFRNFGVGGDLAYNALQRVSEVASSRPDKVIVLVGGNDVLARVSTKARCSYRFFKGAPAEPTEEVYRENMALLTQRLKMSTAAQIALCSLTPIGENLHPAEPFQQDLNRYLAEYSAIVRDIALQEGFAYLPVFERLCDEIAVSPGRALDSLQFLPMYRDAFRVLILRKSPDEIAAMNGWHLHTDGVHLNSVGGAIVAKLVQEFVAPPMGAKPSES